MRSLLKTIIAGFIIAIVFSNGGVAVSAKADFDNPDHVKNMNKFAFELYGSLKSQPDNIFFSPFSISQALAMTYEGARTETETEMAETLNFDLDRQKTHSAFKQIRAIQGKDET